MSGFLTKTVIVIIAAVGIFFAVKKFSGGKSEPQPPAKTIQQVWAEDDKRLRASEETADPEADTDTPSIDEPAESVTEKLSIEDEVQAERLFEMAIAQRKIARLPGMSYKQMVDYCVDIIEAYPTSEYAVKARRMLSEVPQRLWDRYGITDEIVSQNP